MNISKFIENHRELSDMPYLVVYATIKYLIDKGLIKNVD